MVVREGMVLRGYDYSSSGLGDLTDSIDGVGDCV